MRKYLYLILWYHEVVPALVLGQCETELGPVEADVVVPVDKLFLLKGCVKFLQECQLPNEFHTPLK